MDAQTNPTPLHALSRLLAPPNAKIETKLWSQHAQLEKNCNEAYVKNLQTQPEDLLRAELEEKSHEAYVQNLEAQREAAKAQREAAAAIERLGLSPLSEPSPEPSIMPYLLETSPPNTLYLSESSPNTPYPSEPPPNTPYQSKPTPNTPYRSEPPSNTPYRPEPPPNTPYPSAPNAPYRSEPPPNTSYRSEPPPNSSYRSESPPNTPYRSEPPPNTPYLSEPPPNTPFRSEPPLITPYLLETSVGGTCREHYLVEGPRSDSAPLASGCCGPPDSPRHDSRGSDYALSSDPPLTSPPPGSLPPASDPPSSSLPPAISYCKTDTPRCVPPGVGCCLGVLCPTPASYAASERTQAASTPASLRESILDPPKTSPRVVWPPVRTRPGKPANESSRESTRGSAHEHSPRRSPRVWPPPAPTPAPPPGLYGKPRPEAPLNKTPWSTPGGGLAPPSPPPSPACAPLPRRVGHNLPEQRPKDPPPIHTEQPPAVATPPPHV